MSTNAPVREADPVGNSAAFAFVVVVFLLGSLLPTISGVPLNVIATAPLLLGLLWVTLARTDRFTRIGLVVIVFAILILAARTGPPPLTDYGEEKLFALQTSTFLSAIAGTLILSKKGLVKFGKAWILLSLGISVSLVLFGESWGGGRFTVFDGNPIWLGRCLAVAACFAVALPRMGESKKYGALVLVFLPALVMTGARAPLLACIVGLTILLIRNFGGMIIVVAGVLVTYLGFLYIPVLAESRLGRSLGPADETEAVDDGGRSDLWESAFELWREVPGGVGIGNWSIEPGAKGFDYPHNLWLEVASELGTFAIVGLLAVSALACWGLLRSRMPAAYKKMILVFLFIETLGVTASGDLNARGFFFALGLVTAARFWPRSDLSGEGTPMHATPRAY